MSTALVQTFARRPPFITEPVSARAVMFFHDGQVIQGEHGPVSVSVSTHDQYHVRVRSAWKRRLIDSVTAETIDAYRRWQEQEARWYRPLGLLPPGVRPAGRHGTVAGRQTCRRGHPYNGTRLTRGRVIPNCLECNRLANRARRARRRAR